MVLRCQEDLVMLIEIFRHGARNPYQPQKTFTVYPDPYLAIGDLTPVGYRQHYLLGKAIRQKYGNFLPEHYSYQNVNIYASNKNRTLASAMSQVMGIFDLGTGQQVESTNAEQYNPPIDGFDIVYPKEYGNDALPYAPTIIPIKSPAEFKNTMFDALYDCPNLKDDMYNSANDLKNKYNSTFAGLYQDLVKNNYYPQDFGGDKYFDYETAEKACDYLISRLWSDENYSADKILLDKCEYLYFVGETSLFENKQQRMTYNTELMQLISNRLKEKTEGKINDLKILLLSGHDLNIRAFISQFFDENIKCSIDEYNNKYGQQIKLNDRQCITKIRFTSQIFIELYKNQQGQYFVQILLNNEPLNIFQNNTTNKSTLDDFLRMLDESIDQKYDKNCGNFWIPRDTSSSLIYKVGWIIALIVLAFLMYLYFKKRNEYQYRETRPEIQEEGLIQ